MAFPPQRRPQTAGYIALIHAVLAGGGSGILIAVQRHEQPLTCKGVLPEGFALRLHYRAYAGGAFLPDSLLDLIRKLRRHCPRTRGIREYVRIGQRQAPYHFQRLQHVRFRFSGESHQDIRPIQILILNLMPLKEETELQLLRSLSNTPLQVDVTFMAVQSHEAKNTSVSHLNKFYQTFPELKNNKYDGMIITGAPVEQMEFEEVDYWKELVEIMDWTNTHVTSTIYLCWAAQAGLYHHYGLKKRKLNKKMFGLFWHKVMNRKIPLVRGFDDMFLAPHSRHTEVPIEDIHNCKELTVLAESDEAGLFLAMADGGRKIFVMGHPEYDRVTLDGEYKRDVSKNLPIEIPENYYKDNNPENRPLLMWRAHANNLYTNWLNYYVYQSTPFDLYGTPDFSEI